jgi:ribosomal protein S17
MVRRAEECLSQKIYKLNKKHKKYDVHENEDLILLLFFLSPK